MARRPLRAAPALLLALALLVAVHGSGSAQAGGPCSSKHRCSAPSAPTNLTATAAGATAISLSWTASSGSISSYRVYVNQSRVGSSTTTDYAATGLSCATSYALAVAAVDSSGRVSETANSSGTTSACATAPAPAPSPPPPVAPPTGAVWQPIPKTTWQWQITGQIDETVPAQMFDIDLFDAQSGEINAGVIGRLHAKGIKVICYMDTGAWESYRPDAGQFPKSVIGNSTGWSGENWLDIRSQSWPAFEPIIINRMKLAVASGCDGIEPDQNNPVGNNPGFPITYADEKAWYLEVAKNAHALGLSVGMKNGIEIIDSDLVKGFDWTLNEECFQYSECSALKQFVSSGKAVFQVEYQGDPTTFCPQANSLGFSSMKKRLSLDAWRVTC